MAGLGALLILLGIGSLLLPMFDIQFSLMRLFDDYQPIAGIAVAAIGVVLLFLGARRRPGPQPPATPPPPTAPSA